LERDDILHRVKNNAHALLRVRPRSEQELRERLKGKGYDRKVVEAVVDDLKKRGELDDKKFAKFWVNSRKHLKPVGEVVLRHELKTKGVDESVIEATLTDRETAFDEYEVAKKMAEEKFARFRKIHKRKAMKRVYDFLTRRGFKFDVIRDIIEELESER
jgi:regulatory protein